jgi:hypothetical protein
LILWIEKDGYRRDGSCTKNKSVKPERNPLQRSNKYTHLLGAVFKKCQCEEKNVERTDDLRGSGKFCIYEKKKPKFSNNLNKIRKLFFSINSKVFDRSFEEH